MIGSWQCNRVGRPTSGSVSSSSASPICSFEIASTRLSSRREAPCASLYSRHLRPNLSVCASPYSPAPSAFDFTSSGSNRVPGERRNRGRDKDDAKAMDKIVSGLTHMNKTQVHAVAHLLTPEIIEGLAIAARLPRPNQGRKRQEGLIAKLMRKNVEERDLEKLVEAVQLAEEQNVYQDRDIGGFVDMWREGLLEAAEGLFEEVLSRAERAKVELSAPQLGQLIRQCIQSALEASEDSPVDDSRVSSESASMAAGLPGAAGDDTGRGVQGLSMVMDADLVDLLAHREGGLKPGLGKRAKAAPLPEGGKAFRRQAAQLAVNALSRALRPIAEFEVLGR